MHDLREPMAGLQRLRQRDQIFLFLAEHAVHRCSLLSQRKKLTAALLRVRPVDHGGSPAQAHGLASPSFDAFPFDYTELRRISKVLSGICGIWRVPLLCVAVCDSSVSLTILPP